jgi:TPR repeat protein
MRPRAEQGDAIAQSTLRVMYYNGEGVPEDDVLAYMWANLTGPQGHENTQELKDLL